MFGAYSNEYANAFNIRLTHRASVTTWLLINGLDASSVICKVFWETNKFPTPTLVTNTFMFSAWNAVFSYVLSILNTLTNSLTIPYVSPATGNQGVPAFNNVTFLTSAAIDAAIPMKSVASA